MVNKQNIPSEWLIDDDFTNQRIDYFLKKKILASVFLIFAQC